MNTTEQEDIGVEKEITRCSWCDEQDRVKKVYACPGDDLENPRAYHKKCFEALKVFVMLVGSGYNDDEPVEELVKIANLVAGVTKKKK